MHRRHGLLSKLTDGSGAAHDDRWHSSKESEEASGPARGEDGLHRANPILGVGTVDGPEGQGRSDDGDEHEQTDGHGLLVEIGHLLHPVGADGPTNVGQQALTPRLRGI